MIAPASEYAHALREVAGSMDVFAGHVSTLEHLHRELGGDPEVAKFFADPTVPSDRKTHAIDAAYGEKLHPHVRGILHTFFRNQQFELLEEIVDAAHALLRSESGSSAVLIESAVALSDRERSAVERKLTKCIGRSIDVTYDVDIRCIGGLRVLVNTAREWDGTVRGKFERLRRHIMERTA